MSIVFGLLTGAWRWGKTALVWLTKRGRWIWAAAALTVALGAFLIIQVREARTERDALSEALLASQGEVALLRAARIADSKAVAENAVAKQVIQRTESVSREVTEAALAASPSWANQPVPPAVLDSLRQ